LSLADDADVLTMARYRSLDLWIETKSDLTPVTEADRAVEEALRARIERERPGEVAAGAEYGVVEGDVRWSRDPIDGTTPHVPGLLATRARCGRKDRGRNRPACEPVGRRCARPHRRRSRRPRERARRDARHPRRQSRLDQRTRARRRQSSALASLTAARSRP